MLGVLDARPNAGYYYVGLSKETQTAERLKSFLVSDVLSQAVVVNGDTVCMIQLSHYLQRM